MPVKHSLKSIPFLSSILTLMEKMHKSTSYTNKVHLADEVETVGYSQIFEGLLNCPKKSRAHSQLLRLYADKIADRGMTTEVDSMMAP